MLISAARLQIAFKYATGQGAWESTQALLKFARTAPHKRTQMEALRSAGRVLKAIEFV